MYNNLIYFILVLLVFTSYQPSDELFLPGWASLAVGLAALHLYRTVVRQRFQRLLAWAEERGGGGQEYYGQITRLSILALVLFIIDVLFLGLKDFLVQLPLVRQSSALTGLAGLAAFSLYLIILWSEAFPAYTRIYHSQLSRRRYVWSQLRFNLPIVLPWLLLSVLADLTVLLPWEGVKDWLNSPTGEIIFFVLFLSVLVVFLPALIQPLWGLKPLPEGPQRRHIEDFCRKNGFAYREIMLWPLYEGEALTAGVMGLTRRWRFILVTKALLRVLDEEELESVLAHELGHVKRRHLLFYVFFFLGYLVLAYSLLDLNVYLYLATDWTMELLLSGEGSGGTMTTLALSLPVVVLMIVYFRFVFGVFMRNFERQADLFAFMLKGSVSGLVTSLEKIAFFSGQSRNAPSWHHFSVAQRVDFLNQAAKDPWIIRRHDRKVRLMLGTYFLALIIIGLTGYQVQQFASNQGVSPQTAIRILEKQTAGNPGNAQAFRFLGDLYYQDKQMDKAVAAYDRAVELQPDEPENLNNLAWVLVTKDDVSEFEKTRAVKLAERAVSLKPTHYILDTLAEAYFVSGRTADAVRAIDMALAKAATPEDRRYLLEQKKKFQSGGQDSPEKPAHSGLEP